MSKIVVGEIEDAAGSNPYSITLGTEVAHGGGTTRTLTDIPSGVKKVTVMIEQLSSNGTDNYLLQIGPSGGVETSGYDCDAGSMNNAYTNSTAGFLLMQTTVAASLYNGTYHLYLFNSSDNQWGFSGGCSTNNDAFVTHGQKSISGVLNKISITTTGGSNVFDSGAVNIQFQ